MEYWENCGDIVVGDQKFNNIEELEEACFENPELIEEFEEVCYLHRAWEDVNTYLVRVQKES